MKREEKILQKLRRAEQEIVYAVPPRAARLTARIARFVERLSDEK